MRIYLQWARSEAVDWQTVDISKPQDWRGLPKKDQPTSQDEPVDEQPGWVNAINCQGIVFSGFDHYTADGDGTTVTISGWQDSANDFPPGTRYAFVWLLAPPAPDERIGGKVNTRQTLTIYAEDNADLPEPQASMARPWSEFEIPHDRMVRHGKWLTEDQFAAHRAARAFHGWREWA